MMKKIKLSSFIFLSLLALAFIFVKFGGDYRTQIFRSFCQGNWYILQDSDKLYTMGYYGVRKYQIESDSTIRVISESNEFCKNTIAGRGGTVYGNYLYVSARSFLAGQSERKDSKWKNGVLLVYDKTTLTLLKSINSDIKLVEAKVFHKTKLLVSGLGGFDIYDIKNPKDPLKIYSYRGQERYEYQGFDFYKKDGNTYVVFANWTSGISIWNVSDVSKPQKIRQVPIQTRTIDGKYPFTGNQTFHIIVKYPVVYATLGPSSAVYKTNKEIRGMLVLDISKINDIKAKIVKVPVKDWWKNNTGGDFQPTYIGMYKNRIFVNFGEKGVASFNINDPLNPKYTGIVKATDNNNLIVPIFVSNKGVLYSGSHYFPTIYIKRLCNENK